MSLELRRLEADLVGFEPSDATEAGYREEMLELVSSPSCCARSHFMPGHFTASAFVLSPDDQDLLLIFHGKLHRWLQPGGHVDPQDEHTLAAARREVLEEVDLSDMSTVGGLFDLDVHEIPALRGEPGHKHFDLRYLFRAGTRQVQAGSDARDVRWVPLAHVTEVESDASVMRAVRKLLPSA